VLVKSHPPTPTPTPTPTPNSNSHPPHNNRIPALSALLQTSHPETIDLCLEEPRLLLPAVEVMSGNFEELVGLVVEWLGGGEGEGESGEGGEGGEGGVESASSGTTSSAASNKNSSSSSRSRRKSGAAPTTDAQQQYSCTAVASLLRGWTRTAPLLLVRRAGATAARLASLPQELAAAAPPGLAAPVLAAAASPARILEWVGRDPRVLLTRTGSLGQLVADDLPPAMLRHRDVVFALVAAHPSYLVLQLGALMGWVRDVCHLLQVPPVVACRLVGEPQVSAAAVGWLLDGVCVLAGALGF